MAQRGMGRTPGLPSLEHSRPQAAVERAVADHLGDGCGLMARDSFSEQFLPDLIVSVELAGVHAAADLTAVGAERRTSLDEQIDHVIVEWKQSITPLVLGLEHDSLGA